MIGEMHQRLDGNRTLYENCKDMAILLDIIFMILDIWMRETSGHGLDKKRATTYEL